MLKITKMSLRTAQKDKVADDCCRFVCLFASVVNASSPLASLSTVGQSAGTVLKHSWYFVRKKGNAKFEKEKQTVHERKKERKKKL